MGSGIVALLIGAGVFVTILLIGRRFTDKATTEHKQRILSRIYENTANEMSEREADNEDILKGNVNSAARFIRSLPVIGEKAFDLTKKAGMEHKASQVVLRGVIYTIIAYYVGTKVTDPLLAIFIGLGGGLYLTRGHLKRKINKRNEAFINQFPDAVDMIVRSVRSGHPLNTALRMIAENMDPPVRTEFRQLVDEIAYGRTTVEALIRMSTRIDEPDLQFFVVILSVQQETGGNLAEVLSNLSGIIRKRKQLRLRIKAMTSEGRATAYILGSLPILVFAAIHFTSPDYMTVLFTTDSGHFLLGLSVGLVGLAAFIVNRMLQIDI